MGMPDKPLTLTPEQIEEFDNQLSELRHNVNGCLAVIIAATELMRRKPETAVRMIDAMAEQPQKIVDEMQKFTCQFEKTLGIRG